MNRTRLATWLAVLLSTPAGIVLLSGCANHLNCASRSSAQAGSILVKINVHSWHQLLVSLTNATSHPVDFRSATLPWEWRYSLWVKAFANDTLGSPLAERFTVAELPLTKGRTTLLPGRALEGTIDLRERYPGLRQVLKQRSVVVFWSYVPELEDGTIEPRVSGTLTIPRSP